MRYFVIFFFIFFNLFTACDDVVETEPYETDMGLEDPDFNMESEIDSEVDFDLLDMGMQNTLPTIPQRVLDTLELKDDYLIIERADFEQSDYFEKIQKHF